jgi:Uma2 family endonuclease
MVAIVNKLLTFESFLAWDDGSDGLRPTEGQRVFELVKGVAVPLSEPNARHEDVVDGLCRLIADYCQDQNLDYIARQNKQVRLKALPGGPESSRKADIVLFDKAEWEKMRRSSASAAAYVAPPLVIEVVSTNWGDDYRIKLNEYEILGILEYWIVDLAGFGGVQYIGSPKQPTVTVNRLIDGEYQAQQFQGEDAIVSPTFPEIQVSIGDILAMTEV